MRVLEGCEDKSVRLLPQKPKLIKQKSSRGIRVAKVVLIKEESYSRLEESICLVGDEIFSKLEDYYNRKGCSEQTCIRFLKNKFVLLEKTYTKLYDNGMYTPKRRIHIFKMIKVLQKDILNVLITFEDF